MEYQDYRLIEYLETLENINDKLMVMALYYDVSNIIKPIFAKIFPNEKPSYRYNVISVAFQTFLDTEIGPRDPRENAFKDPIDLINYFVLKTYRKWYPDNMSANRGEILIDGIKIIDEEYLKSRLEKRSVLVKAIDSRDISFGEKVSLYLSVINNKQEIVVEPFTKKMSINI